MQARIESCSEMTHSFLNISVSLSVVSGEFLSIVPE